MADRRETVEYDGDKYHRYPDSDRRHLRVYFWAHTEWKESPVALHRQKWINEHGEVPDGCDIHHEDGDPLNNAIENLVALSRSEHAKKHLDWGGMSDEIREAASEWHGSEAGHEWHKEHYENVKDELHKKRYEHICDYCGDGYATNRKERTRFCSDRCQRKQYEKENQERRECEKCSAGFEVYKHSKRRNCYDCHA